MANLAGADPDRHQRPARSATHGMVFAITERENRNRYGGSTPPRLIERWRQLIIIYQAVAGIGSVFGPAQGFETWILFQQKTQK
jgi:hypothetical protein